MTDAIVNAGSQRQRLVVLIGPPKTASTSLQGFLAKYAYRGSKQYQAEAFGDWNYPVIMGDPNGIKDLRYGYNHSSFKRIRDKFERQDPSLNLVTGSEYLISFNSKLDGNLFQELSDWTGGRTPEVVIMSRSPRTSHLVSIWKQQTQVKGKAWYGWSFLKYMCSEQSRHVVESRVGRFADPLNLAYDLIYNYNLSTYILDMGGVKQEGLDICHAFSCSILKASCTSDNKWVKGLENVIIQANSRQGDPGVNEYQQRQIENILHRRDCSYRHDLQDHNLFHLIYNRGGIWPGNCSDVPAMPAFRKNASALLDQIRSVLECPGYPPFVGLPQVAVVNQLHVAEESISAENVATNLTLEATAVRTETTLPSLPPTRALDAVANLTIFGIATVLALRLYSRRRRSPAVPSPES